MIVYKLTDQNMRTQGAFQYTLGEWVEATGENASPCSEGVLHAYETALHAALFNSVHSAIKAPRLFECETEETLGNDGLKTWHKRLRPVRELPLPEITTEKRVEFAIRCAALVCPDLAWHKWANGWLDGSNRSKIVAARNAAAVAARNAADVAAHNAADAAAYVAARNAADAAAAVAYAAAAAVAYAAAAAVAARNAAYAAAAAAVAAVAARNATYVVARNVAAYANYTAKSIIDTALKECSLMPP